MTGFARRAGSCAIGDDGAVEFVGVDLAWGERGRTGLAALDGSGALVDTASVRTDDEIDAWLAPRDLAVVAVDAPLLVPNETGMRSGEAEVTSAFGRYGAGCHATNRGRPWFDPPRGELLARRHGWTTDPRRVEGVVCVEVYPHAALVGLFALPYRLAYKRGRGRMIDERREEFSRLLGLLESVRRLRLMSSPVWARLRTAVEGARRQVDLDRVEDEIDAIVCADLAWRWRHEAGTLRVYGDPSAGYLLAPPPPTHAARRQ
ncbi:DUF429 domain-containing protein [Aeromicrobium sp. YIM 150415]|uniref:DUF429 domain-containing protein n=1 Tax=Aeromicrobium sp. YIM 150415 TaxID=2803912 RepID=UPI001964CAC4|nr:DUF429 domain-containing protein [Aeromicrobium sp. YIM 150415]MBM9463785.1 DUF429 domain-containing protein [Aeromicrobium sp. YIM 150415]